MKEAEALARLYDLDLAEDPGDLDLYLALAARVAGPVLELAVGSGRLAVPLARAGHHVTGVDIEPAMLARARARLAGQPAAVRDRLELVEADIVGLALPSAGSFALGILALNSLMLLATRDRQRAAFRALSSHLHPGGLAVVDVWLPDADDLSRCDGRIVLEYPRHDPETGLLVTKAASAQHDAATGLVRLTAIYEEGSSGEPAVRWVRTDTLRLVSADDLRLLAEEAGLEIETMAGGYDLEPLGAGSDRAVIVAVRR